MHSVIRPTCRTRCAQETYARAHSWRSGHIRVLRRAQKDLAEIETTLVSEREWLGHLEAWHQQIATERAALSAQDDAKRYALTLNLAVLERGPGALDGTGFSLVTTRLGQLMRAAGYQEAPPSGGQQFGGLPWFGSIPEVRTRVLALNGRREEEAESVARVLAEHDAKVDMQTR